MKPSFSLKNSRTFRMAQYNVNMTRGYRYSCRTDAWMSVTCLKILKAIKLLITISSEQCSLIQFWIRCLKYLPYSSFPLNSVKEVKIEPSLIYIFRPVPRKNIVNSVKNLFSIKSHPMAPMSCKVIPIILTPSFF